MDKQRLEILKKQYEPLAPSPVLDLIAEVERLEKLACAWKASAKRQRSMAERWMFRAYDVQATVYVDNQMRWKPILAREEEYQAQQRAEVERLQAKNEQLWGVYITIGLRYITALEILGEKYKHPYVGAYLNELAEIQAKVKK